MLIAYAGLVKVGAFSWLGALGTIQIMKHFTLTAASFMMLFGTHGAVLTHSHMIQAPLGWKQLATKSTLLWVAMAQHMLQMMKVHYVFC